MKKYVKLYSPHKIKEKWQENNKKIVMGMTEVLILWGLIILIARPLLKIFSQISITGLSTLGKEYWSALEETVITTILAAGIVVPFSFICSFFVVYSGIKFKKAFCIISILPMFLPPISFGFSLIAILGKNGLLYLLFGIRIPLLGRIGIVLGLILYTFPVSFLILLNSMRRTDPTLFESACMLGISTWRFLVKILLPQIKGSVVTAVFSVMVMSFAEYGICLIVGGKVKTLALLMYREALGTLNFSQMAIFSITFVVPVIIHFIFKEFIAENKKRIVYESQSIPENKWRDILAYICFLCVSVIFAVVVFSFVMMCFTENYPIDFSLTWRHLVQVLSPPYLKYYINSILISSSVAVVGCILAVTAAYFADRGERKSARKLFWWISTLPQSVPGILYGIGYIFTYKKSAVYNTSIILIMVNIAHFFSTPFLLSYYAIHNIGPEYDDIIQLCAIPEKDAIQDIYLPYMHNTILDILFYYFANSMITISAVAFLYTSKTMPYSLLLNNFEGTLEYLSRSSAVSLVILLTNLCAFIFVTSDKRKR